MPPAGLCTASVRWAVWHPHCPHRWFAVSASTALQGSRTRRSACNKGSANAWTPCLSQARNWNSEAAVGSRLSPAVLSDAERGRPRLLLCRCDFTWTLPFPCETCVGRAEVLKTKTRRTDRWGSVSSWSFFGGQRRLRLLLLSGCVCQSPKNRVNRPEAGTTLKWYTYTPPQSPPS